MQTHYLTYTGIILIALCILCSCTAGDSNIEEPHAIVVSMASKNCYEELGINGKWYLVDIIEEGKEVAPSYKAEIDFQGCSSIATSIPEQSISKKEKFTLYRVKDFCDDYQLVFENDSVCCMSLRGHDTMVFGDCNNREAARFYYRKIK